MSEAEIERLTTELAANAAETERLREAVEPLVMVAQAIEHNHPGATDHTMAEVPLRLLRNLAALAKVSQP